MKRAPVVTMGVSMKYGQSRFTRMPWRPVVTLRLLNRPSTACFAAQYCGWIAMGAREATEPSSSRWRSRGEAAEGFASMLQDEEPGFLGSQKQARWVV